MAVRYLNNGGNLQTSTNNVSCSVDCTPGVGGSDTFLIAFVFRTDFYPLSSVTYDSDPMSYWGSFTIGDVGMYADCYYMVNPNSGGGGSLAATHDNTNDTFAILGLAYDGVDQITPITDNTSNSASSTTSINAYGPTATANDSFAIVAAADDPATIETPILTISNVSGGVSDANDQSDSTYYRRVKTAYTTAVVTDQPYVVDSNITADIGLRIFLIKAAQSTFAFNQAVFIGG